MSKKYIYDDKGMNVRKSEGTTVLGVILTVLKYIALSLTVTILY